MQVGVGSLGNSGFEYWGQNRAFQARPAGILLNSEMMKPMAATKAEMEMMPQIPNGVCGKRSSRKPPKKSPIAIATVSAAP